MQNSGDNVFQNVPVGKEEATLLGQFLAEHDFAANTRKAVVNDLRKFARWFSAANKEPFVVSRVTVRDVADFRDQGRRNHSWSVSANDVRQVSRHGAAASGRQPRPLVTKETSHANV